MERVEQQSFDEMKDWLDRVFFWVRVAEHLKAKGMHNLASRVMASSFRLAA